MDSGSFKRVTDGWAYQAPNPWIFGDAPHYLVNDAQKAQIQTLMIPFGSAYFAAILALGIFVWTFAVKGIVRVFYGHLDDAQKAQIEAIFIPRRPALLAPLRLAGGFVWMYAVASIVLFFPGHGKPSFADLVAIVVLFAISLVPVAIWLQRRRLEPILAGLPPTQERITRAEMRALRNARETSTDAAQPDAVSKRRAELREYMRARFQPLFDLPSTQDWITHQEPAQGEEGIARLLELELLRRGHFNALIDDVGDDDARPPLAASLDNPQ